MTVFYLSVYKHTHTHTYVHAYIHTERKRLKERDREIRGRIKFNIFFKDMLSLIFQVNSSIRSMEMFLQGMRS